MPGLLWVAVSDSLGIIGLLIQVQVKYLGHRSFQGFAPRGAEFIKMLLHGAQRFANGVDLVIIFFPLLTEQLDKLLQIPGSSFHSKAGNGLSDERQDCVKGEW